MMKKSLSTISIAALLLAVAWPAAAAPDFSKYVSIGDSLTAGYCSGGLVVSVQTLDYPALIAAQGGAASGAFQQPTISEPGIPPLLYLQSLVPLTITRKPGQGVPTNLSYFKAYNNLGIPGAISLDILQTVTKADNPFFDIVLRGGGTVVAQATGLSPSFMTCWIGNNDILGAAISGRAIDGVTMTPISTFTQIMTGVFQYLAAYKGRVIVGNIPDVTTIPYCTAVSIYITNPATGGILLINGQPVPLIGPEGPLTPGNYVLLSAIPYMQQGYGIPVALGGRGEPLPDLAVLSPGEVSAIQGHVNSFNQTIASLASANGIPVVDFNGFLKDIALHGYSVGGVTLTSSFVTGGMFSLDGVHPTDLGYAVVANKWIERINTEFKGTIPWVNLNNYLKVGRPTREISRGWGDWNITPDMIDSMRQIFLSQEARELLEKDRNK